jgi:polysaccharide export outer membrane protein
MMSSLNASRVVRGRTLATGLVLVVLFLAGPGLVGPAFGQANSDFWAYPRDLVTMEGFSGGKNARELTFNRMPGLSPDYKMGPGDELEVTIVGHSMQTLRISTTGEITIPFAGAIKVTDLTAEEAEAVIAERLAEKGLIKNPQVLIYISKYEAKTIYAVGEVDRPGEYSVSFQMTLMDLIFLAGGIDFTASRYGYLHRRSPNAAPDWRPTFVRADISDLVNRPDAARAGGELIEIDLQPMKDGGVLERNLVLRNGDVLYVPRREIEAAFVIGDVMRTGAFELPQEKKLTASRLIAMAGGPTRTAKMSKGILVRADRDGKRTEFPVDFAAVLKGDKPDVEIRPNDVVFIPGSTTKTLGFGILNTIPGVLTTMLIF